MNDVNSLAATMYLAELARQARPELRPLPPVRRDVGRDPMLRNLLSALFRALRPGRPEPAQS